MMLGLAAILMLFAAFTSAYVVRKGLSDDWKTTAFPGILWLNSVVLLASSFTLEKGAGLAGVGGEWCLYGYQSEQLFSLSVDGDSRRPPPGRCDGTLIPFLESVARKLG